MAEDNGKKEMIEALHLVISEFDENPISDTKTNDVIIEIISERIERLIEA